MKTTKLPAVVLATLLWTGVVQTQASELIYSQQSDNQSTYYGTLTGPGVITSLSATTLPRSGFLEIFGTNLGGNGPVLIDGISAIVATRENARVVAYVPETARLTTVPVKVLNGSGQPSNTVDLTVTPRAANGRVKWRFQAASDYILQRPGVGADGTVVAHDSNGFVYALQPDGGLKWIYNTGRFAAGPPSIGPDGTVYVAGSGTITAINPDGSLKWTFDEPPGGQGVIAGPGVGPDGNIYAVTDLGGLGALALSPAGQLLWSNHGDPVMAEYGQLGVEMSFGPSHSGGPVDQFYVAFDDFGSSNRDHMYAFRLTTGEQVWTVPIFMSKDTSGMMQQQRPVVGSDGTVFLSAAVQTGSNWSLNAFNPANGTLLRSYFPSPGLGMGVPTVGPDDTVYFGQSLSYLQAVSAGFAPRWTFFDGSIVSNPVVSPANDIVFTGGAPNYGMPGFARAFSTANGQLLWSLNLGIENGGNQVMESIPRFTPDGSTVYFGTAILGGNTTFCFLYALDTTGNPVLQNAVSRKTHSSAGSFDVDLPLTGTPGIECRSGGATNDYTMMITFSGDVIVTGTPQAEVIVGTGCVGSGGACNGGTVTVSGAVVAIPLTNIANAQTINVRLNGVNSAAADTPPSDVVIPMTKLVGDTSANGSVNSADVAQTKGRIGQQISASNFRSDVNASGGINSADITIIKQNLP